MQKTASRIEVKKVNLYWKNEFLYSLNDKLMLLIKFMMIFYMKNMQKCNFITKKQAVMIF